MTATRKTALAFACIALTACAAAPPPMSQEQQAQLQPVVCETAARCAAMWQRAQLWVVNNAAYKMQISNDVVIQTFSARRSSVSSGVTITREPIGGQRQRINFQSACDNLFGCQPSGTELRMSFNRYLRDTPQ